MLTRTLRRARIQAAHSILTATRVATFSRYMADGPDYRELDNADKYTQNSRRINTITLEDIEEKGDITDLRPAVQNKLEKNGIEKLFPVQEAVSKLFLDGQVCSGGRLQTFPGWTRAHRQVSLSLT